MNEFRIGHGYDIHRLVPNRKLIIGGVHIESELGLDGHSDADVAVHAVMDALLGAASLGDIGTHFPDTDPAYANADSIELLKITGNMIEKAGYSLGNVDVTIVAENPRMAPFIGKMRENIAGALGVAIDCISVKATSNEKIGAIGRGEGIAAMAIALLHV